MSTQAAPAPEPEPTPPKEVPQSTDAYRKAHKSYVLAAGLLASWELIGITLDTKEKWGIELKSPKAVPLILFTLVFYSAYKMTIEWLQCDSERRRNKAARLDFWIAHLIALTAVGISVFQYLARIQIVDWLNKHPLPPRYPTERPSPHEFHFLLQLFLVAFVAFSTMFFVVLISEGKEGWKTRGWAKLLLCVLSIPASVYAVGYLLVHANGYKDYLEILASGGFGILLALVFFPPFVMAIEKRLPRSFIAFLERKASSERVEEKKDTQAVDS